MAVIDAKELLELYKDMTKINMIKAMSKKNKEELELLFHSLTDIEFRLRCKTEKFPVEHAPDIVYLFDLEREMFWGQHGRGYTRDIYSAGLFSLKEALGKVKDDLENNTKIVYFGE